MKGNFVKGFGRHDNPVDEMDTMSVETANTTDNLRSEPIGEIKTETVVVATTKISSTMEIYGEIKSKDAIQSVGQIFGDVTTTQSFSSKSLTIGNISALNVAIREGRVKGDIAASEGVEIGAGSIMVGNIECGDLVMSGKVKGNCDVRHDATLLTGSLLAGNIVADNITTEQGARINGNVTMRNNDKILDIESEFDLGGDF